MERIIEICAGSYQDCIAAYKGKAKRVELNSALSVGGLTPSVASLVRVKKETDLSVICMVRPRAAGFCYEKEDVDIIFEDAKILLENGADGISFGFLRNDGSIHKEYTKEMVDLVHSYQKEVVFHRAFDVTPDAFEAIETLIELGVDRVLTSGQKPKAMEGIDLIKVLNNQDGERIQILRGRGMNAENARIMMNYTGVYQVHSSCKNYKTDTTTTKNDVSYSYLESPHENDYDVVDVELVKKLVDSIK